MSDLKNLRQAQDSIRRTRFMPLSRSERVALAAEAVGHILPYANSAWLYIRPDGKLEDCITYPHCYPDLQKVYASELHDSPTRMGLLPWRSLLQIAGVVDPGQITLGLYFHSDFFKLCMEPAGLHDSLAMGLMGSNGRAYGIMAVARPPGEKFSRQEKRMLADLQYDIGRACDGRLEAQPEHADFVVEEEGLLIVSRLGRLLHADAPGKRLLWLASHPHLDREQSMQREEDAVLSRLAQTAQEHQRLGNRGPAPSLRITHDRGQYDFRVHMLDSDDGTFGVVTWRSTSRLTRVARKIMGLSAGPRQKDIAVLLARGLSYPEIAEEMAVAVSSVATQVRWLFSKYGVNSREELVAVLDKALVGKA